MTNLPRKTKLGLPLIALGMTLALSLAARAAPQPPRVMTTAERQRSCANAEGIWVALEPVIKRGAQNFHFDPPMRMQLDSYSPIRIADEEGVTPARYWLSPDDYWTYSSDYWQDLDKGALVLSPKPRQAPSPLLVRQWMRTPATSIFECKGFAEKRASESISKVDRERTISVSLALPMISSNGSSAFAYIVRSYGDRNSNVDESFEYHLRKTGATWRVVGVLPGFAHYGDNWEALQNPRPSPNASDNEKGPASPPGL